MAQSSATPVAPVAPPAPAQHQTPAEPIPRPASRSIVAPQGFKIIGGALLVIFIILGIVREYSSKPSTSTTTENQGSGQQAFKVPADYKELRCDLDQVRTPDYSSNPNPNQITVNLHEGAFCEHFTPPKARRWETFFAQKTQHPGEYASVWCSQKPQPESIRYEDTPYLSDRNPRIFNQGGDFRDCPYDFFLEGNATLVLTPTGQD